MVPTPDFLTEQLRRRGVLPVGEIVDVQIGRRFPACADELVRLHLTYSRDGGEHAPRTLICKVCGPAWYDLAGLPELHFYRDLAPRMAQVPVPALYGACDLPDSHICMLLLEDLAERYTAAELPIAPAWLEQLIDVLVQLHASWWHDPRLDAAEWWVPQGGVTRMAQALDTVGIGVHEAQGRAALERFLRQHQAPLTADERRLLALLASAWGVAFRARTASGKAITLIHGDLHLLGNVFLAKTPAIVPRLKIIDWGQVKRGLGSHDVMFALHSVDVSDRVARDTRLLRRYHAGLCRAGVTEYGWEQCLWDYRFSLLTNVYQALFQQSLHWFRKTVPVLDVWNCRQLLDDYS